MKPRALRRSRSVLCLSRDWVAILHAALALAAVAYLWSLGGLS